MTKRVFFKCPNRVAADVRRRNLSSKPQYSPPPYVGGYIFKTRSNSFLRIVALLLFASALHAQYAPPPPPAPFAGFINEWARESSPEFNAWDFGGASRSRLEIKDGFAVPGSPGSVDFRAKGADVDNQYFLERIRLHTGYSNSWWGAYVEGQSSLAANDERYAYVNTANVPGTRTTQGMGPESDTIDLHQAYFTLGNPKEFPLSLKVGRQVLSYGEERLVGAFDWNNIGRTFDAAKLRWQSDGFSADLFTSRPVIPEDGRFDVSNDYDWFSGLYATITKIPRNSLELYFFSRNASPQAINAEPAPQFPQPTARDVYTAGGRLKSAPGQLGNWDYTVEGAYQFGDFRPTAASARLTQDAFAITVQGGYTFANAPAEPRLGFEYAYSSGDSNPADGTHGTFDNLFPTNHKFYGYMDFVSWQNIQDVRGIFQIKPSSRLRVALEGHGFWLADTHDYFYNVGGVPRTSGGYGIHPNYSSFLGTELDLIAGYAVARFAQVEGGFGHFFTGEYIQQSLAGGGGARDANYVYLQLNLVF